VSLSLAPFLMIAWRTQCRFTVFGENPASIETCARKALRVFA
jgi:hypothetical protein